jgi:hypothetical protein
MNGSGQAEQLSSLPKVVVRKRVAVQTEITPGHRAYLGRSRHPVMIEQMDARSSIGGKARPIRAKVSNNTSMAALVSACELTVPSPVSGIFPPVADTPQVQSAMNRVFLSPVQIRRLSGSGIMSAVEAFRENLERWEPDAERMASEDQGSRQPDVPLTQQQKRLDRLMDTHAMILRMEMSPHMGSTIQACYVGDQPVGFVALEPREIPYVDTVFTHPGLKDVGGVLIEQAVKTSIEWGKGGKLKLTPLSTAQDAYERLGFVLEGNAMTLDPVTSDKWCLHNGEWRLREYVEEKNPAGFEQ